MVFFFLSWGATGTDLFVFISLFCVLLGKTVFNTSTPGDKLKYLQYRFDGLTKALASAGELGTCNGALVEQATEYEATLSLDVQEEEAAELERVAAEEKAAAKAAKKKKKKK